MRSIIFRYGGLMALFLVALETARRSYVMRPDSIELYVAAALLGGLFLGAIMVIRLRKHAPPHSDSSREPSLNVVDGAGFSKRELDVLLFLSHGYSNREIADQLSISDNTVKTHLKNIYSKLGVSNRTQAAAEAKLLNIIA